MKIEKDLYVPISIVISAFIIVGGILFTGGLPDTSRGTAGNVQPTNNVVPSGGNIDIEVSDSDHIRGNPSAKVTLVEFSDFECPFCQRFHPSVVQALEEYGDDLRWVYKHFPLTQIHPQAFPAAEASECVWEQKGDDGFWEFTDAMFNNQGSLGLELYQSTARSIGVNMNQFDSCVSSRRYQDKVQADLDLGTKFGVTGTPASYVNGVPVRGAVPYEQLKAIIDAQL